VALTSGSPQGTNYQALHNFSSMNFPKVVGYRPFP